MPEEKVIFMLNAENVCSTTLAKLKSQHSSQEARAISEEVRCTFVICDLMHFPFGAFPIWYFAVDKQCFSESSFLLHVMHGPR